MKALKIRAWTSPGKPMPSLNLELRTGAGVSLYEVPLSGICSWWEGLVSRNAQSRLRDEVAGGTSEPIDQCSNCGADPVHFTLIYINCTQRVCRKCKYVLEDLVWLL